MKKILTSVCATALFTSAFALDVSEDKTITDGISTINFTAPNVTLTITGKHDQLWYSPRANFGDDYVYTDGDKVTVKLESGASIWLNDTQGGLFGGDTVSSSKVDMYITGSGKIQTTLASITTTNSRGKLFLDAYTDFTDATYNIGSATLPTNLTVSNTLIAKSITLISGSTLTLASDSDSSANILTTANSTIRGTIIQKAGVYTVQGATTNLYGTLDLSVSKGFKTRWLTVHNGSTIIIRADNALMESDTAYRVYAIAKDATTTLKLYADQQFADLWFANDNTTGTLNAYTNGNALTFAGINSTGTLNIFIEKDFS
ncbi:MAG: hypothetical protein J6B07_07975 [Opitutales bacterium]|nr:hypothetical protein [Opitutales bacterium]